MRRRKKDTGRCVSILLLLVLLLLLLLCLIEQARTINMLIRYNSEQSSKIGTLEQEVKELQVSNERLERVAAYQYGQIKSIQQAPKEVVVMETPTPIAQEHKTEPKPQVDTSVIIGILATLGGLFRSLIPAM